jgi:hypothetical protein
MTAARPAAVIAGGRFDGPHSGTRGRQARWVWQSERRPRIMWTMSDTDRSDPASEEDVLDRLAADSRDVLDANWLTLFCFHK